MGPQDGPQLRPTRGQNRSKKRARKRIRFHSRFWIDFGSILDRFWIFVRPSWARQTPKRTQDVPKKAENAPPMGGFRVGSGWVPWGGTAPCSCLIRLGNSREKVGSGCSCERQWAFWAPKSHLILLMGMTPAGTRSPGAPPPKTTWRSLGGKRGLGMPSSTSRNRFVANMDRFGAPDRPKLGPLLGKKSG